MFSEKEISKKYFIQNNSQTIKCLGISNKRSGRPLQQKLQDTVKKKLQKILDDKKTFHAPRMAKLILKNDYTIRTNLQI